MDDSAPHGPTRRRLTPRASPAARIRLGRVFRVESKDYFLLLGTTLFLVVFGLVMVLSSSSVESNLEDGGFFVQATRQGLYALVRRAHHAHREPHARAVVDGGRVAAAHRRVRAPAARRGHRRSASRVGGNTNWLAIGPVAVPAVGADQGRARHLARPHRHEEAGAARRLHARHPADPPRRRRRRSASCCSAATSAPSMIMGAMLLGALFLIGVRFRLLAAARAARHRPSS